MKKRVLIGKIINQFIAIVITMFWFTLRANSQIASTQLTFDIFSQEDGLPNNQIQCIYQDKKGWMWIGTSQGLSRFDGYSFVNFLPNPNDTNSLSGALVRVISEDKNGNIWLELKMEDLIYSTEIKNVFTIRLKTILNLN